MLIISLLSLITLNPSASAKDVGNIPEIGRHQAIFNVSKNVNPQNIAVVYTKVDDKCRFVNNPENRDQPIFDFYWLMDGKTYKPMNGMIKSEFRKRMSFVDGAGDRATHFVIDANDLKEVNHDIADPRLDVNSKAISGNCDVEAFITLGPSNENARVRVTSIYGEGRAFPPKVYSVTIKGVDVKTGKAISRKYDAK
jgi:hypothetical protein